MGRGYKVYVIEFFLKSGEEYILLKTLSKSLDDFNLTFFLIV